MPLLLCTTLLGALTLMGATRDGCFLGKTSVCEPHPCRPPKGAPTTGQLGAARLPASRLPVVAWGPPGYSRWPCLWCCPLSWVCLRPSACWTCPPLHSWPQASMHLPPLRVARLCTPSAAPLCVLGSLGLASILGSDSGEERTCLESWPLKCPSPLAKPPQLPAVSSPPGASETPLRTSRFGVWVPGLCKSAPSCRALESHSLGGTGPTGRALHPRV